MTYISNLHHEYGFTWTIENFSHAPDVVRGPFFATTPGLPANFCIELQAARGYELFGDNRTYTLDVALVDLYPKESHHTVVSGYVSLRRTNGTVIKAVALSRKELEDKLYLLEFSSNFHNTRSEVPPSQKLSQIMCLVEDKLVVKGVLCIHANEGRMPIVAYEDLSNDFKTMYESGSSSDVTFTIGDKTLRAHRNILLRRSPVFATMFGSDMVENNSNTVVIEDADFHSVNCFLKFLYTGTVEDNKWDTVLALYSLAHKYQVKSLHGICSVLLAHCLSSESACSVLVLSDLHGDKQLKDVAKVFIRRHLLQIAVTTEWLELLTTKPELVKEVL